MGLCKVALFTIVWTMATATAIGAPFANQETIRVRLTKLSANFTTVSGLDLRFSGRAQVFSGYHAFKIKWERPLAPGLPITWVVMDRDRGLELVRIKARKFELFGADIRVGLKSVPSLVQFLPSDLSARTIDVVAGLDLETYLAGVLPSEMPGSWPLESLKAQAVAARTFALFRKSQRTSPHLNFDVESDVMDQVFKHPQSGLLKARKLANVERALSETRSVILQDSHRRPFQAYFHADCGGQTEEAANVWGGGPSAPDKMGTAKDGMCPLNPRARWASQLSGALISEKLGKVGMNFRARVASIHILKTTPSGRIDTLQIAFSSGEDLILSGHAFRMALGFDRIKSTHFSIEKTGADFEFQGIGYGHGVGLCQWGARELARAGKSYKEILGHYYPKATLVRMPEELDASPKLGSELASVSAETALKSPKRL